MGLVQALVQALVQLGLVQDLVQVGLVQALVQDLLQVGLVRVAFGRSQSELEVTPWGGEGRMRPHGG